jgi:tetratricopeptide (TPR) repeat protein
MRGRSDASSDPVEAPMGPSAADAPPAPKPLLGGALRAAIFTARQAGDDARLLALLHHAWTALPEATWPPLELIGVHRDAGDKERAFEVARLMLERHPASALAWLQIGLLERSNGNSEAALAAFEQAHAGEPGNVEAVLHMAQEHFAQGRQKRCDELLAQALELDRGGVLALSHCAQRAMMANEAERALDLYQAAVAKCPWLPAPYLGVCNALAKLGRTAAAMEVLDRAIEQCGSKPGLHARRAQLLRDMGFYREARQVGQDGLTSHPNSFVLWETVMRTQLLMGEDEELRQWLTRARATRDSERAMVAALTGDVAAEFGDPPGAIACYRQAAALQPTNARYPGHMAVASLTQFDVEGAAAHLRRQCEILAPAWRLKSRSNNPLQTYFGQIINDYQLDAGVRAELEAVAGAPEQRIEALLTLCRRYPDSTLVAAALLDGLWRSGAVRQGAAEGGSDAIPRRIIQFWDSSPPPDDVLSIMQSWSELNPGCVVERFDDQRARAFLAAHHDREVLVAYHRATSPAMKADLFRLAYLVRCGGVYVDADDRCTAPVDTLLPEGAGLVLYREYLGTLGNNFIASVAGHPVVVAALAQAVTAIGRGDQDILWLATGPGLITRSFAQVLAGDEAIRETVLSTTRILGRREMLRHVSIHCVAGYKDTLQHWTKAAFTNLQPA